MATRRAVLLFGALGAVTAVSSCATVQADTASWTPAGTSARRPDGAATYEAAYAARPDGGYVIPAVPYRQIGPQFHRQRVADPTGEAVGTVVVETGKRFLYLIEPGGMAMRYGVGVGAAAFAWKGEGVVGRREAWPRWTPPAEMLGRKPGLVKYANRNGSMPPGLSNPLGARALYIFQNGRDTLYRIHGTPEWQTIGRAASSGCIRLVNQDIVDLYGRVGAGTRIIVR